MNPSAAPLTSNYEQDTVYFILADCQRARNDRTGTFVTRIGREVKVLFFHLCPHKIKETCYTS